MRVYQQFGQEQDRYMVWCARFLDALALVALTLALIFAVLGAWPGLVIMLVIALAIRWAAVEVRDA